MLTYLCLNLKTAKQLQQLFALNGLLKAILENWALHFYHLYLLVREKDRKSMFNKNKRNYIHKGHFTLVTANISTFSCYNV